MHSSSDRPPWKTLLAFSFIYFAWGSTFLAIRVGVHEVPPLLFAALRFLIAGVALYVWTIARGERLPKRREWGSVILLAFLIFVIDYDSGIHRARRNYVFAHAKADSSPGDSSADWHRRRGGVDESLAGTRRCSH